ncbi:MAG: hypothetical protein U9R15_04005 [Chloroflexota bacterium]|nr:hypothetical protein [Chloroflexota bacterium]
MSMEITIQVPMSLGRKLQHVQDRLPEILERGLREVTAEKTGVARQQDEIASLQEYAASGDYRAFGELVERIDWVTRSPDDLTTAIDLALSMGMSRLPMKLAQLGGRLFPDHERVQRAAYVLAPPVARVTHLPSARGLDDSSAWMQKHAGEYKGQWIAVREGRLLGAAYSFDEIEPLIGEGEDAISTIVTRVL